jgi:hypothetical protein
MTQSEEGIMVNEHPNFQRYMYTMEKVQDISELMALYTFPDK